MTTAQGRSHAVWQHPTAAVRAANDETPSATTATIGRRAGHLDVPRPAASTRPRVAAARAISTGQKLRMTPVKAADLPRGPLVPDACHAQT